MPAILEKSVKVAEEPAEEKCVFMQKIKKLGIVCFLFFLIKGMLWLIVPAAIYFFGIQ